ncbi:MAG: TonB-dependent receptor plug domain-containing protein [Aliidongia sp.]
MLIGSTLATGFPAGQGFAEGTDGVAPATVQSAAAPDAPAPAKDSDRIEQIVVTAGKRAEALNEVPESISVLSGSDLQDKHIVDYQDITRQIPGLSSSAGSTVSGGIVGPNTSNLVIRGVSSTSGSATVALYLDDVSITQSNLYVGAEQPKFFDFDRVEVLRGPQGTLFGASSMGGTIRMITNEPKFDEIEGTASTDLSGTDHAGINYKEDGTINIPLIDDKLALRISAEYGSDSGYINHDNPNGTLDQAGTNSERWGAFRVALKYRSEDGLDVILSVLSNMTIRRHADLLSSAGNL